MSWGDWREVPGGGLTNLSLAGVVDAGGFDLALFCVGLGGYININSYDFKSWSGWSKIPGTGPTMVAVSATSVGKSLYLYGTGLDEVVYYRTFDGTTWSKDWLPVPGGANTRVAVCGVGENAFATGLDHDLYLNPSPSSSVWSKVPVEFKTDAAPAAVTYISSTGAETLFLFVKGLSPDQKIHYNVRT